MHILMIDDELDFLTLMQQRFAKRNIEVTTVSNGAEGLKLVQEKDFDIVIVDVKMPEMDGIEVLRRIKNIKPELVVLLLSGHADVNIALSGVEAGAADYMMKPVAINDLIFRITEVTGKKV